MQRVDLRSTGRRTIFLAETGTAAERANSEGVRQPFSSGNPRGPAQLARARPAMKARHFHQTPERGSW